MPGIRANLWLLAPIIVSTILQGCSSAQPLSVHAPAAMPVKLLQIHPETVEDVSTFVGVLKSRQSVTLQSQVAGQVSAIYVKNGDDIAVGKPIIDLDRTKQQATVNSFAAAIESNRAEQNNALETLKSLEATRISKQANVKYANQEHDRYLTLSKQGAVSQEQVDNWENQHNAAVGDLQSVEAQIQAQKAAVAKAEKLVKQSTASMKEQQAQLRYFSIVAPFAGTIGDIPVKIGQYVTTDTPLTTMDQNRPLELYLSIPTNQAPKLSIGTPVEIIGQSSALGKVFFISPQVNNDNQSVLVKARIDNADKALRPGQNVTARVTWSRNPGLTIPTSAVSRLSGQDFVFVAEPGPGNKMVAKQRPVKLGDIVGESFKVISGVNSGERVVTSGVQNLTDGAAISPQS